MIAFSHSTNQSTACNRLAPEIRRLRADERDLLCAHLLKLCAAARRKRFSRPITDEAIRRYIDVIDWSEDAYFALGAFVDGELRGVAECCLFGADGERQGELSFSVDEAFQRRGLGSLLFGRILSYARNRNVRTVSILTNADNHAVRTLAARHGMSIALDCDLEGRLELDGPTPQSLCDEFGDASPHLSVVNAQGWAPQRPELAEL